MTGHIRIVNDPVELVPLFVIFNTNQYRKIFDLLNKDWMTKQELSGQFHEEDVEDCLLILKKGNLIEEKWRMPKPGEKPDKEFRATYSKFRANFQCNFADLADLLYIATSNDEELRQQAEHVKEELKKGNSSINDIARRFSVSPVYIKGIAKRLPHMDVKGQGLVSLEKAK